MSYVKVMRGLETGRLVWKALLQTGRLSIRLIGFSVTNKSAQAFPLWGFEAVRTGVLAAKALVLKALSL